MFKIDYYDKDASNPEITQRVMTILKRSEY